MSSWANGIDALTEAEKKRNRDCMRNHRDYWVVVQREGNASAFNGYRWQRSAWSLVRCDHPGCTRPQWRTKAAYVRKLPDAKVIRTRNADGSLLLARGDR